MRKIFVELLRSRENGGSIANVATTNCNELLTVNGTRTRKTCGFFIPQIQFTGQLTLSEKAEFVARLIRRTKADPIRTNKASRLTAVVDTLSHLLQVGNSLLITVKRQFTMKQSNTLTSALNPIRYSQPFSSMGVSHA
ncbi:MULTISPECIES: hypothetical protein [unclassified Lonepinella]|uniref:hypothetical protein n=1 Tax=unclassified Lonepinella TaxID=2642006 RepID=UPI0036D7831F